MKLRAESRAPMPHTSSINAGRNSVELAARRVALQILLRVERDRAFADVLLGRRLDGFATADRRLITQLVLGTLAWQGRLDFELSHHSTYPLERLAPAALAALRMGLFQVRILSRVPPHAAVDTAVSLTRELAGRGSAGLVNAVLRNALRFPVALPPREADQAAYLAVAYSHPRWLVEKLIEWFGMSAAESLMAANNEPAPNALRLNLARGTIENLVALLVRDGMEVARHGRFPESVILKGAPVLNGETWKRGLFQLQGEASQIVSRLLAPLPKQWWLIALPHPVARRHTWRNWLDLRAEFWRSILIFQACSRCGPTPPAWGTEMSLSPAATRQRVCRFALVWLASSCLMRHARGWGRSASIRRFDGGCGMMTSNAWQNCSE